jgi:hypothetical protein
MKTTAERPEIEFTQLKSLVSSNLFVPSTTYSTPTDTTLSPVDQVLFPLDHRPLVYYQLASKQNCYPFYYSNF